MQVFKAYFKVMRASRHTLLVNFNVFFGNQPFVFVYGARPRY